MNLKVLLAYNVKEHRFEEYYRYIMQEFLPRAQRIGLYMTGGWETLYGDYPSRLIVLEAQNVGSLDEALTSDTWDSIETKLGEYVSDYERRVVQAKPGFQFFIPQHSQS